MCLVEHPVPDSHLRHLLLGEVLLERLRIQKHRVNVGDAGDIPFGNIVVKSMRTSEHISYICNARHIPRGQQVLVEGTRIGW